MPDTELGKEGLLSIPVHGFLLYLLLSLFACTPTFTTVPNKGTHMKPVEIDLPLPPSVAFERVMAGFVGEGLKVAEANKESGIIKSAGMMGDSLSVNSLAVTQVLSAEYFFHANILPSPGGSKVFLTLSQRIHTMGTMGLHTMPETELYECPQVTTPTENNKPSCEEMRATAMRALAHLVLRIQSPTGPGPE